MDHYLGGESGAVEVAEELLDEGGHSSSLWMLRKKLLMQP